MKKKLDFAFRIKTLSAYVFAGLIILYIIISFIYSAINQLPFADSMPYIFILRDLLLAILIAVFYEIFLTDTVIKKMRYYLRIILFSAVLWLLFFGLFIIFYMAPMNFARLWLLVAGGIIAGITIVSIIGEIYLQTTGKRYTKVLDHYKSTIK